MAYNNSIPQSTDLLSQSQDDILNNFAAIKTLVDVNHVTFDAVGQGKHNFIQFPIQNPVPTTGAGEVGFYCQTSALTGNPELVFSHESAGSTYEFTAAEKATAGYAILPSGIIFKWGSGSVNAGTTAVATFANGAGIPALQQFITFRLQERVRPERPEFFIINLIQQQTLRFITQQIQVRHSSIR